ncbi:putative proline dehydrogenase/delta-1-pyrroline-5-carboxylate dehydrogenase [Chlamydiales bacterium STE3]|nr:putative proline dehydrogenase/delta-1-pyrroline-5-carboxylate dehydrogenase [Chlamydiales bacterium STE3]
MSFSSHLHEAKDILLKCKDKPLSLEEKIQVSIELAVCLMDLAHSLESKKAKAFQKELSLMIKDPKGKVFAADIADQIFRSQSSARAADQFTFLLQHYGIPPFIQGYKRWGLYLFQAIGKWVPHFLVPFVQRRIRKESQHVILSGEKKSLHAYLKQRKAQGVRVNLNRIGEAILGEDEASRRLNIYLEDLANPEIAYISVKSSSIYSQINLLAWEATVSVLSDRLRALYRAADKNQYCCGDKKIPKFVNLDMEEYRDLLLTVTVFKKVLDEPEFLHTSAGIVLQSYLPDSYIIQQELTEWALKRIKMGGAPIKIRIVKGANLAMEKVEASMRDWNQAPYLSKQETDANFIAMTHYAIHSERAKAVHIGIGSHNVLDVAYALVNRAANSVEKWVNCEMLEGMADGMSRAIQMVTGEVLLYSPVVKKEQFQNAISYLVRRLDENTAKENFLSHYFGLKIPSPEWHEQVLRFRQSCQEKSYVSHQSQRKQDRQDCCAEENSPGFKNEADTDWSLPNNRLWIKPYLKKWQELSNLKVPLVIDAESIEHQGSGLYVGKSPSLVDKPLFHYSIANQEEIERSVQTGLKAFESWKKTSVEERGTLLRKVAQGIRERRGDLIGAMCINTGKTVLEADPEVSEAIDFVEYYCQSVKELHHLEDIRWHPKGLVLIAPPWNFSCAIPTGGIIAALATGNTVLFKPAQEAALVGYELVKIFWEAGISKTVLQFINCLDEPEGSRLVRDQRLAAVVLTGATATAELFLKLRPDLDLIAETGGKNAIIVTAMADRDLAIKDIVQSAFGYSGQKCSACSLLILEKEVYNDPFFKEALKDAAKSLKVGSPFDLTSKVNPLIKPPENALLRGLTSLEPGESWLLQPQQDSQNPNLWSPGIKWGVQEGNFTHQTEFFGPLLGVICAENLEHAIRIANGSKYGLTSGLHSLDLREQRYWRKKIIAGNCYINRTITGAIVARQPFGGCKDSSFGKGAKAGGPNYLHQFMRAEQVGEPFHHEELPDYLKKLMHLKFLTTEQKKECEIAFKSYCYFYKHYFSRSHDPLKILGQDNILQYVPREQIVLRIHQQDALEDLIKIVGACWLTNTPLELSVAKAPPLLVSLGIPIHEESDEGFLKRISTRAFSRIRLLKAPSEPFYKGLAALSCRLHSGAVLNNGRLELVNYLREVVFSIDYHRYGYLGIRENKPKKDCVTDQKCNSCKNHKC